MKHVSEAEKNFNKTYKTLWPQVYRFIYYKVQNAQEAEELTQDVFQKVFRHFKKDDIDREKLKAYIFTSARNTIYDLWRKNRKRPKVVMLDELSEKGFEVSDERQSMEDSIMVEEALKLISKEERKVLELRILQGYQINEVAELMGKPLGTIKSLQYRAIRKLRDKLAKGGYFDE